MKMILFITLLIHALAYKSGFISWLLLVESLVLFGTAGVWFETTYCAFQDSPEIGAEADSKQTQTP